MVKMMVRKKKTLIISCPKEEKKNTYKLLKAG